MRSQLQIITLSAFLLGLVPWAQANESSGDVALEPKEVQPSRWETRHQWFDFNLGFGMYGAYGNTKLIKLRWDRGYWQVLRLSVANPVSHSWGGGSIDIGTEAGGAIRLSERTELLIGLGVGVGVGSDCYSQSECSEGTAGADIVDAMLFRPPGIYLMPGVTLSTHIKDHFALNFGVEMNIFSGIYLEDDPMDKPYPAPNAVAFIGFTI